MTDDLEQKGPAKVTFMCHPFFDENGVERRMRKTVLIEDGDFQGVIDAVREDNGAFVIDDDGIGWFLPWPPAAIKIEPAP